MADSVEFQELGRHSMADSVECQELGRDLIMRRVQRKMDPTVPTFVERWYPGGPAHGGGPSFPQGSYRS